MKSVDVAEDMDSSPTVQVRWLEQPQIERVEVAQRHRVLLVSSLLKVEGLELCNLSRVSAGLART